MWGIAALVSFAVLSYSVAVLAGVAPLSTTILIAMTTALALASFELGSWYVFVRKDTKLGDRISSVFWMWMAAWFWVFAPIYFLIVINFDDAQLRWATFGTVSGALFIGIAFILIERAFFSPVDRWLNAPQSFDEGSARRVAERVDHFPLYMSMLSGALCIVGYTIAAFQLHFFAAFPGFEIVKNICIGCVIALFFAATCFVTLQYMLHSVRSQLAKAGFPPRRSEFGLSGRMILISACVVAGSFFLLTLVVIRSYQDLAYQSARQRLDSYVAAYQISPEIVAASSGYDGIHLLYADALDPSQFSPETIGYVSHHATGVIKDLHGVPKILELLSGPDGSAMVAVMTIDYADALSFNTLAMFVLGSCFVFLVSVVILGIVTSALTHSLHLLIAGLRRHESSPNEQMPLIASNDEVGELSETLTRFTELSRELDWERYEFIATASHQLRTPLTQLVWTIETIEREGVEKSVREYFPVIKSSIQQLNDTIKLLLDTRHIEDANARLYPQDLDLAQFIRDRVEVFRASAKRKHISISIALPDTLKASVDPTFLDVAVEALLSNAIEYTREDGDVSVTLNKDGDRASLSFTDTGIGIPKEVQAHIFQRFIRAPNAERMRPGGTGLGLYIAKKSIVRLGGTITLTSEEGRGTTIVITIPLQSPAEDRD